MFRLSNFMREVIAPGSAAPRGTPTGPVVIWNLVRRCNLSCRHCYSGSADRDFAGELSTDEVRTAMADLRRFGVPALILSGGEPLLRPDIFVLAAEAKALGFHASLSTNGTLIDAAQADRIQAAGFDYVGISIDGIGAVHDRFRGQDGAYARSLAALRLCRDRGLKVGVRFTMTEDNHATLPDLLQLMEVEGIARFYLSHLNYAGRGNRNKAEDAGWETTRKAMETLFDTCRARLAAGRACDFVTGNNDSDGPLFYYWVRRHHPEQAAHIEARLRQWGGNASGVNVANIDNLGWVHPDTMWGHERLGNVRQRPFSSIWSDRSTLLMAALAARPRPVGGRCAGCRWLAACNGNSRVRAEQVFGDRWAEDPGCTLTDAEIAP